MCNIITALFLHILLYLVPQWNEERQISCPGAHGGLSPREASLLGQQSSTHSMSFSDKEERESPLPNGRSISLMDLQDSYLAQGHPGPNSLNEAPPRLCRVGSQASIGPIPPPHLHQPPIHPKVPQLRDNLPQSAPQMRRPIHPSLSQQRSLQTAVFPKPRLPPQ